MTRYILLIYLEDEVIETYTIECLEETERFGKQRIAKLGDNYWYKIKAD